MSALLLVLLLVVPLTGCLALLAAPRERAERQARHVGLAVTTLTLLDAVALAFSPRRRVGPAIGLRLHLGVDGISLPLVLLTALLTALCAEAVLLSVQPQLVLEGWSPAALL